MKERPNVLIILTDQQRYDTVCAAGYEHMITPSIDRLASEGCIYLNGHSTNPVCMPARHDLITGLPARAHGYFTNSKSCIRDYAVPTLPRLFSENGYRTAAIGKMHFYPSRMHHGFSEMYLMEELPKKKEDDQYAMYLEEEGLGHLQNIHGVRPHIYHIPQNSQMDEEHHGTTWVAEKTIEWLKNNKENPFFLMTGFIQPHPPWDIPERFQNIYKEKKLPEPIPLSRYYPDNTESSEWFGDFDNNEYRRKIREAYYTAVTMVDYNVGKIINYLESKGELDNTLIIYTSDHGEMLQDKGYYSKEVPYDSSIRIPFIVRYPKRFNKGKVNEDFVDLFDIMPTCLDICGIEYNGNKYILPGESLVQRYKNKDRDHQISAFGLGADRWVMCRNKRYKYIYTYNLATEQLYDMRDDPGEIVNLLEHNNSLEEVYKELKNLAIDYEKKWGPKGYIIDNNFLIIKGNRDHDGKRGKYKLWMNKQFQYFDIRDNKERGRQFEKEMEYALKNYDFSKITINEVFKEKEWEKSFVENWNKYGYGDELRKRLFDNRGE